jgi:hypothetical protein
MEQQGFYGGIKSINRLASVEIALFTYFQLHNQRNEKFQLKHKRNQVLLIYAQQESQS